MKKLTPQKNKRIFWLGMHKLLVTTELKRLKMLGYEVFNPHYLSSIIDQSAVCSWTPPSDSTLPQEAIAILSKTNFFYSTIPKAAVEILNHYFGTVIVTINPDWLKTILKIYHGRVIYRTYGQTYRLSRYLVDNQLLELVTERENFWFCPHHEAALLPEDPWLNYLKTRIIPYCLSDDVIDLQDTWEFNASKYNQIGLMCPRVLDNPYYTLYFNLIKQYFSGKQFKIFGVQIVPVDDPQVIGTLDRKDLLAYFLNLSGFIYHYLEPSVCYLPPIEFMTLGGPVVFQKGSLLSKYFGNISAPGEAKDIAALSSIARLLRKGSSHLANEIIDSQKKIRSLYHPNYVWPIFDKAITEIIETDRPASATKILYIQPKKKSACEVGPFTEKMTLIPFHTLGSNVEQSQEGMYYAAEGVIRVTSSMVKALTQHSTVIITSYRHDFARVHGFFVQHIEDYTKLKILILEKEYVFLRKIVRKIKFIINKYVFLRKIARKIKFIINNKVDTKKSILTEEQDTKKFILNKYRVKNTLLILSFYFELIFIKNLFSKSYVKITNQDKSISQVIVPHYYLFPEMQATKKSMFLYLPDYMPHFYKDSRDMGSFWLWRYIGKKLATKAKIVLTSSEFTRNYLPNSVLKIKKEKIAVFPLPYLNSMKKKVSGTNFSKFIGEQKLPVFFIFYPTRNRPSKRLDDFSKTVMIVNHRLKKNGDTKRIYGVLTTKFTPSVPNKYLITLPTLSNQVLEELYKYAVALLFTSENEGNFPPQINEALYLGTPVIASNIPQITGELGETSNALQLISVGDCMKFSDAVLYTLDNREQVLHIQKEARDYAIKHFSYDQFSTKFLEALSKNSNID
jgi:glycosyltransferase involved in cell wall biosynthesis